MIYFDMMPGYCMTDLGYIPGFLDESDPRPAAEQIEENYSYGGGWNPMKRWERVGETGIKYPGDSKPALWGKAEFRDEMIYVYDSGWTMIVQKDGTFEVARLD